MAAEQPHLADAIAVEAASATAVATAAAGRGSGCILMGGAVTGHIIIQAHMQPNTAGSNPRRVMRRHCCPTSPAPVALADAVPHPLARPVVFTVTCTSARAVAVALATAVAADWAAAWASPPAHTASTAVARAEEVAELAALRHLELDFVMTCTLSSTLTVG